MDRGALEKKGPVLASRPRRPTATAETARSDGRRQYPTSTHKSCAPFTPRAEPAPDSQPASRRERLHPGRTIAGRYRLLRCIGRGGMGEVWSAQHLQLRELVAVKFLSVKPGREAEAPAATLRRFHFEAQVGAQLGRVSGRVVAVHDFGLDQTGAYMVMEYVRGRTLRTELDRKGPMTPERFAALLRQVGEAVAAAHAAGIVHRDLKPANLLLVDTPDGALSVKVADFGVAKALRVEPGADEPPEPIVGSPAYMSPEQLLGCRETDERSDLWSLGVVAYEALTGQRPFQGTSGAQITVGITSGAFAPPRSIRPELPRRLDAWFARALATRVPRRFASIGEMVEAFERAIAKPAPRAVKTRRAGLTVRAPVAVALLFGLMHAASACADGGAPDPHTAAAARAR